MQWRMALRNIVVLLAMSPFASAEIYTFTDKEGKVHYTDQPPESEQVEAVELEPLPKIGTVVPNAKHADKLFREDQVRARAYKNKRIAAANAIKKRKEAKRKACEDARQSLNRAVANRAGARSHSSRRYYNQRIEAAKEREDEACKLSNFR